MKKICYIEDVLSLPINLFQIIRVFLIMGDPQNTINQDIETWTPILPRQPPLADEPIMIHRPPCCSHTNFSQK
jgi:hypothetical protein